MVRRPPRATRTDTLLPYTTLCRSIGRGVGEHRRLPSGAPRLRGQRRDQGVDDATHVGGLALVAGLALLRLELGEGFRAERVELCLRRRTDVLGAAGGGRGGGATGDHRGDGE